MENQDTTEQDTDLILNSLSRLKDSLFQSPPDLRTDGEVWIDQVFPLLEQEQKSNAIIIIKEAEVWGVTDMAQVSFILATALWDSSLKPMIELRAPIGTEERKIQDEYWFTGYYGRGFTTLNHKNNYEKFGVLIKENLVSNPNLLLFSQIAAKALVLGMQTGTFTGNPISDYINGDLKDFQGARKTTIQQDNPGQVETYAKMLIKFAPPYQFNYDSPISLQNILISTFQNPKRKDFPDYPKTIFDGDDVPLLSSKEQENIKFMLDFAGKCTDIDWFKQQNIFLSDVRGLYPTWAKNPELPPVDKHQYLENLKNSDWYGPYQYQSTFLFYSKVNNGSTNYFVRLQLWQTNDRCSKYQLGRYKVSNAASKLFQVADFLGN